MKPAAYVHIKFLDGEIMRLPFASFERAEQFYRSAQKRHDAFSVRFVDPELELGYARKNGTGDVGD